MAGSHDRSVSVWQKKGDEFVKELANLSNKLSVICGLWAPNGDKFAIGTSCKSVYIGFYHHEEKFWSGIILKSKDRSGFNSTITTLAFHKSSNLIAIGSADFSVRVLTCSLANQNLTTTADVLNLLDRKQHSTRAPLEMWKHSVKFFFQSAAWTAGLTMSVSHQMPMSSLFCLTTTQW